MATENLNKPSSALQKTFRTLDITAKVASPFYGVGAGILYSYALGRLGVEGVGNIALASFFGLVSFEAAASLHVRKEFFQSATDPMSQSILAYGRSQREKYPKFLFEAGSGILASIPTFLLAKAAFDGYHAMPLLFDTVAAAGIGVINGFGIGRAAYHTYN